MSCHRIKKYSQQIVCQDMVLSCQPDHIEEIPLFKCARVTAISLRNQRASSGREGPSWLERDSDLSAMLVSWHLWSSRGVPFTDAPSRLEKTRRTSTEKRKKTCNSSLTLRNQSLYMSIEKYLLFLMPREITSKRTVYALSESCSRQDRFRLSALYVDTALGLRQYQLEGALSDGVVSDDKGSRPISVCQTSLSPERMCFPFLAVPDKAMLRVSRYTGNRPRQCTTTLRKAVRPTLSLHCPSVLGAPDIQDIAQSGLMTLEGSLTLELC